MFVKRTSTEAEDNIKVIFFFSIFFQINEHAKNHAFAIIFYLSGVLMILGGSLEFEKGHNREIQERPSDNIELPEVTPAFFLFFLLKLFIFFVFFLFS